MAELSVKMTSDEAELFVKMQQLISKTKETEKVLVEASAASTEASKAAALAAREQQSLGNQGKRIAESLVKSSETLEEAYNRQAALIAKAGEQGKLSADEQAKAMALLRQKTDEQVLAQEQAARAQEQAAIEASEAYKQQQKEVREGVAEVNRLIASTKTLEEEHEDLKRKIKLAFDEGKIGAREYADAIKKLDDDLEQTKRQQNSVFGAGALKQLGALAATWLTVSTATDIARKALELYNQEREKGQSETQRLESARRNLLQVSQGDFSQLQSRADEAAKKHGVDRVVAMETLFSARSEGFEKDYEAIMATNPLIPVDAASRVAGQTAGIFGNKYDSMQMISGVYKGAVDSRLNFQQVAQLVPEAAEGGALTGASAPETIAAVSVLATQLNNPAARLKALGTKMGLDSRTKGLGFIRGVETLMGMSAEDRTDFLGESQELNTAYDVFSKNISKIRGRSAGIENEMAVAGSRESLVNQRLLEFGKEPILVANELRRKVDIAGQIQSEMAFSEQKNINDAYRQFIKNKFAEGKIDLMEMTFETQATRFIDMLGGDVIDSKGAGLSHGWVTEFQQLQRELVQNSREQSHRLKQIAENPSKVLSRPGEDK